MSILVFLTQRPTQVSDRMHPEGVGRPRRRVAWVAHLQDAAISDSADYGDACEQIIAYNPSRVCVLLV